MKFVDVQQEATNKCNKKSNDSSHNEQRNICDVVCWSLEDKIKLGISIHIRHFRSVICQMQINVPWTFKNVAVKMTCFSLCFSPQKYSPPSEESTFLIVRKSVEILDVMVYFSLWAGSENVTFPSGSSIEQIQVVLGSLLMWNHDIWVSTLEELKHRRVTCAPSWTSEVINWELVEEMKPKTTKRNRQINQQND